MFGCCDSCFGSSSYEDISKNGSSSSGNRELSERSNYQSETKDDSEFHLTPGESEGAIMAKDFDPNSSVFEGLEIQQKFTNKSVYEMRFMWINLHSRTIHMSQYITKDRRHKEASLSDITSVIQSKPAKFKNELGDTKLGDSLCLTINFKRGGGIDLLFKSEIDCTLWFTTLKQIIRQNE